MIKKILSVFIVFALVFSLGACKKKDDDTVTTADNSTSVSDTTADVTTTQTTVPGTNTPGATIPGTKPAGTKPQSAIGTFPAGTKLEIKTQPNGKPVDSQFDSSVGSLLKSEKYTMKFDIQMDGPDGVETLPVTAYISGKKIALKTSMMMDKQKLDVIMIANGNDFKVVMPFLRAYATLPAEEFSELMPPLDADDTNTKYVGTTKVKHKGVDYICESYESEGTVTKYYFSAGELKRIEIIDADGTPTVFDNVVFTPKVDESVFKIPKGYVDMSKILSGGF